MTVDQLNCMVFMFLRGQTMPSSIVNRRLKLNMSNVFLPLVLDQLQTVKRRWFVLRFQVLWTWNTSLHCWTVKGHLLGPLLANVKEAGLSLPHVLSLSMSLALSLSMSLSPACALSLSLSLSLSPSLSLSHPLSFSLSIFLSLLLYLYFSITFESQGLSRVRCVSAFIVRRVP